MSQLPCGWAKSRIGDVCTLNNGRAFKPVEWSSKGLPIVRIQNLNNPAATFNYFDGDFDQKYHLNGGELLFAWSGTPGTSFGAHVWRNQEAVLNQHIFRVDFNSDFLDKRFFKHAINQTLDHLIDIAHGGVGLRHVTKGKFENTGIAIPPVGEQKRIADKLDCLLARVDACRDRLDSAVPLLRRFRQAILAIATSGRLTADWRSVHTPNLTETDWRGTTLSDLCESGRVITYGVIKLGDEIPDGVPCLRTSNVRWLDIELDGIKRIAPELSNEYRRTILQGTEVLVNVRGTLGGVVAATQSMKGWNVSREVAVVPVSPKSAFAKFIELWVASDASQRWLRKVEKGVAYVGINIEDLKNLPVALPPMDEQTEIVRRVKILFAFADRLDVRIAAVRQMVGQLTPALLAKAFRGELVPQDPADEPATELLKRLVALRSVAPQTKRGKKASL